MKRGALAMSSSEKYKNGSLPLDERVEDLLSRLTLEEKAKILCVRGNAVERLGIPEVKWHGECLHGLINLGVATQFPMSIGMAATFNRDLIRQVGTAIGKEARNRFHDPDWQGPKGPLVGVNYWSPNINILRDPRWGRGQETFGEDPVLTGQIGLAFVKGLQGEDPDHLRVAACAKHFAVHSGPEPLRSSFDAKVSRKDLVETYLPAFKMLVDAGVETVMAAYNRVNGIPCPAHRELLQDTLRKEWGFKGHVVSDGGAITAMHKKHHYTKNGMESVQKALGTGCDLCNDEASLFMAIPSMVKEGKVDEKDLNDSVRRVLKTQFKLGFFDLPELNPHFSGSRGVVRCQEHLELARQTAVESIVMVKNAGILPIPPSIKKVHITGPTAADVEVLIGNFYRGVSPELMTIVEGISASAHEGTVITYMPGSYSAHPNISKSNWHIGLGLEADIVIACVGLTPLMEGEEGECIGSEAGSDRKRLSLPAHQVKFVKDLHRELVKHGKRNLILVVTGGTPISLGELYDMAEAVLFVWYPGERGGLAVGQVLFGKENPSGKLPVSIPYSEKDLPDFKDYSMRGRTYRYMEKPVQFPFGFGLGFSPFRFSDLEQSAQTIRKGESLEIRAKITNQGEREGQETIQLYLRDDQASARTPRFALKDFSKIKLQAGESRTISFTITAGMMELVLEDGRKVIEPGEFSYWIGGASPDPRSWELGAPKPLSGKFKVVG
jgi:beta-glucosidase